MTYAKQSPATITKNAVENNAIYIAFASGFVGLITGIALFHSQLTPLYAGIGGSLGLVATFLGAIISFVFYIFGTYSSHPGGIKKISNWTLALTHALLIFIFYALLFYIIGQAFKGAALDAIASTIILALSSAFAGYYSYLSAFNMNTLKIAMMLTVFLVVGVFISMLTANDAGWWRYNFSALGAGDGVSGSAFNGTLIIAGLVAVSLSSFLALDLKVLKQSGYLSPKTRAMLMRTSLAAIGIALAGVGIFVVDAFPMLHVASAVAMAVIFGLMIIALPWIVPNFSKAFYFASYTLLAALAISSWLFLDVGYFNLTALEIVIFAIIFIWLILFVRHIAALLDDDHAKLKTPNLKK